MMDNSGIPQNKKTAVPNPAVGAAREQPLSPSPLDRTRPTSTISSLPCEFNYQVPVPLDSVDGKTLMNMEIPPLCYCVEPILPHGLFVLAGPPKAGKTWLVQQISHAVVTGTDLWGFPSVKGDVLYLALEDTYARLQSRFEHYGTIEGMEHIHFVLRSKTINGGLIHQICEFLAAHADTQLVVIDTMQHIRSHVNDKNMYAADYETMNRIREITNRYRVTVILVTHTRKMEDADPVNMITGSTGISGGSDGMWVLLREKRTENNATLTISNRDTPSFEFSLTFDDTTCLWMKNERQALALRQEDHLVSALLALLAENRHWQGTSSKLLEELAVFSPDLQMTPATLSKKLRSIGSSLHQQHGIIFNSGYSGKEKIIKLDIVIPA